MAEAGVPRRVLDDALPHLVAEGEARERGVALLELLDDAQRVAIVLEATLGFLGLGAQPPLPSWGAMMSGGTAYLFISPWVIIFPGLAMMITVLGFNLFGDALVDLLDIKDTTTT